MTTTTDSTTARTTDSGTPAVTVWHLLPDRWRKNLRAKALSPLTERGYLRTALRWADWLVREGLDLEPAEVQDWHVDDFIAGIVESTSAANAMHHYRNLRVYFGWLVKRKEMSQGNPMNTTEPPRVEEKLTPVLTEDEDKRLIEACAGRDFFALRDTALVWFMKDTGARVSEVGNLDVDSIMLGARLARVVGKGNKERLVGFGSDTALAFVRYLKARSKLLAGRGQASSRLWLGQWGRPLSVDGIKRVIRRRGHQAGIARLHAHRFRHTYAHNWKLLNGSTEGLMATGGWASSKMAEHYGKAARTSRALAEQQRLMHDRGSAA